MKTAIISEIKGLLSQGAKEIILLGQNVNNYGLEGIVDRHSMATCSERLVALIKSICKLPELERLRFTTSNPHNFTPDIADLFNTEPKLGRYIHLPVQSGSNDILKRMNRRVTREAYLEKLSWLRSIDPQMAISTDLIVGFPGESDRHFEETLDLVQQAQYSFIYAFKYSPRPKTPAARFKDQIPLDVKKDRLARLMALQDGITFKLNQDEVGQKRKVLCLYKNSKATDSYYGRTEHFRLVKIRSKANFIGKIVEVEIIKGNKTALEGVFSLNICEKQ